MQSTAGLFRGNSKLHFFFFSEHRSSRTNCVNWQQHRDNAACFKEAAYPQMLVAQIWHFDSYCLLRSYRCECSSCEIERVSLYRDCGWTHFVQFTPFTSRYLNHVMLETCPHGIQQNTFMCAATCRKSMSSECSEYHKCANIDTSSHHMLQRVCEYCATV